ncbi:MAG TPA: hypothetical protein VFP23_00715 [Solirubrobacterales bacterium]|nr:hypothetical protein [Solirubrobacterales bacterium]
MRHPGVRGREADRHVPDAPVSKFTLSLKGGARGLIQNSEDLCAKPQRASAEFTAHNGKLSELTPT